MLWVLFVLSLLTEIPSMSSLLTEIPSMSSLLTEIPSMSSLLTENQQTQTKPTTYVDGNLYPGLGYA
jgi:hypothetical protein